MAVGIRKPGNQSRLTAESYIIVKYNAQYSIMTLELEEKNT